MDIVDIVEIGEHSQCPLSEFLRDNEDLSCEEVSSLMRGEEVFIGGGAAPLFRVRLRARQNAGKENA